MMMIRRIADQRKESMLINLPPLLLFLLLHHRRPLGMQRAASSLCLLNHHLHLLMCFFPVFLHPAPSLPLRLARLSMQRWWPVRLLPPLPPPLPLLLSFIVVYRLPLPLLLLMPWHICRPSHPRGIARGNPLQSFACSACSFPSFLLYRPFGSSFSPCMGVFFLFCSHSLSDFLLCQLHLFESCWSASMRNVRCSLSAFCLGFSRPPNRMDMSKVCDDFCGSLIVHL